MANAIKAKEIAEDLGISINVAYELIHQKIPFMQVGRRVIVMRDDYEEWKKKQIRHCSSAVAKRE